MGLQHKLMCPRAKVLCRSLCNRHSCSQKQPSLDPVNPPQWECYAVQKSSLNSRKRSQADITLSSVRSLAGNPVSYGEMEAAVEAKVAAGRQLANRDFH